MKICKNIKRIILLVIFLTTTAVAQTILLCAQQLLWLHLDKMLVLCLENMKTNVSQKSDFCWKGLKLARKVRILSEKSMPCGGKILSLCRNILTEKSAAKQSRITGRRTLRQSYWQCTALQCQLYWAAILSEVCTVQNFSYSLYVCVSSAAGGHTITLLQNSVQGDLILALAATANFIHWPAFVQTGIEEVLINWLPHIQHLLAQLLRVQQLFGSGSP
jgi:hypothetical protein